MTCRELIDFLMDYTDGKLDPAVKAEFDRHLSVCASCVAYLESYRRTVTLARDSMATDNPVPSDVPKGLVNAILEARRRHQSLDWMWERIESGLKQSFRQHPAVWALLPEVTKDVERGKLAASTAARPRNGSDITSRISSSGVAPWRSKREITCSVAASRQACSTRASNSSRSLKCQ